MDFHCARCGRMGSRSFSSLGSSFVCTSEKACRRRIELSAWDDVQELSDNLYFEKEQFCREMRTAELVLGTFAPSLKFQGRPEERFWIGVRARPKGSRAAWLVIAEESAGQTELDCDDLYFGYHQVVSNRWDPDAFSLMPLTASDLASAAQDWVDNHVRSLTGTEDYIAAVTAAKGTWPGHAAVPAPNHHYPKQSSMDTDQLRFFQFWKQEWREGRVVDVKGHVGYLYAHVYEVLGRGGKEALRELERLGNCYSDIPKFPAYLYRWRADIYMLLGEFGQALQSYQMSWDDPSVTLSLRAFLGMDPTGEEIAKMSGCNLRTKFRSHHRDELFRACEEVYARCAHERGQGGMAEWIGSDPGHDWPIFIGAPVHTKESPPGDPRVYWLDRNGLAVQSCQRIMQTAEELVRARLH